MTLRKRQPPQSSVDVIIPCRNAPEVLSLSLSHYWLNAHEEKLVSSVSLFDNRSTAPGMMAIQQEAKRRCASVFINERNVGVWASVNRGLVLAQSEYILVLTSDVLLSPGSLGRLVRAMNAESDLAVLGPIVSDGLGSLPWLYESVQEYRIDRSTYNGACWLMRRNLLEQIGYFDPQFYVCFGDLDFMLRVKRAGWQYGVLGNARCVHLDKVSRRQDHSVDQDNEMEIKDWTRFAEKWKNHAEILQKHPCPDRLMYALIKEQYWSDSAVII